MLAEGALGPVYKARRISDGKPVLRKMLSSEMAAKEEAVRLFLRQMTLTAKLDHPHLVPLVEIGQAGCELWLAMEFIEGVDARQLAQRLGGTVPWADGIQIMCQVLEALNYAHGRNLVHRDVKPSNIMVTGRAGEYNAFLTDFGLMRNVDEAGVSEITKAGVIRGTLPFMPPEQVLDCRFVKPAGDIYSAGAALYWLLTQRYVYDFDAPGGDGRPRDPYLLIVDDHVPIVPLRTRDPSIPEPLAKAIEMALAYDPEDRYESARHMAEALAALRQ